MIIYLAGEIELIWKGDRKRKLNALKVSSMPSVEINFYKNNSQCLGNKKGKVFK